MQPHTVENAFLQALAERIVVADGAMGTMLQAESVSCDSPTEADKPDNRYATIHKQSR